MRKKGQKNENLLPISLQNIRGCSKMKFFFIKLKDFIQDLQKYPFSKAVRLRYTKNKIIYLLNIFLNFNI